MSSREFPFKVGARSIRPHADDAAKAVNLTDWFRPG